MNRHFYVLLLLFTAILIPSSALAESMSSQNYSIESGRIDAGSVSAIASESEHYRTEYTDDPVSSVNESDDSSDDGNDGDDDSDDGTGSSERRSGTDEDLPETTEATIFSTPAFVETEEAGTNIESMEHPVSDVTSVSQENSISDFLLRALLAVFVAISFGFIRFIFRHLQNKRHSIV